MDIRAATAATSPYAGAPPLDPSLQRASGEPARTPTSAEPSAAPPEPPPDVRATRSRLSEDLSPQGAAAQVAYQFQTLQDPGTRAAERQAADAQAQAGRARLNMVI